jgi:uncharacterized protein YcgL (UPF0745 family)
MSLVCQVFKSSRNQEMYLYVEKARGVQDIPDDLMTRFGEPLPVMLLLLTADHKLARADAAEVLASIERQGFYLQMPPTSAEFLVRESSRG